MSAASILGLGAVSAAGTGLGALRAALAGARPSPEPLATTFAAGGPAVPVFRARPEWGGKYVSPRDLRRVDRFSQCMALAAFEALEDAGLGAADREALGLVVATGYGPLTTSFAFSDDMVGKRDSLVSPLLFAGSVHTAPGAAIGLLAGVRGPTVTVTGFDLAALEALELAVGWLESGAVEKVLVVAGDEFHPVGAWALEQRLGFARDGRLCAADFERCSYVPGESYAALVLGRAGEAASSGVGKHGRLGRPRRFVGRVPDGAGPLFIGARGAASEGRAWREALAPHVQVAACAGLWGGSPTSDAHAVLAAALCLEDGRAPAFAEDEPASVTRLPSGALLGSSARCVGLDSAGRGLLLEVEAAPTARG